MTSYTFTAELWEHDGEAAWFFLSLPSDIADEIEATSERAEVGFGSVPVEVRVGATTWSTSLFPDSKRATYVLPVKKAVRIAEGLSDGSSVETHIRLR